MTRSSDAHDSRDIDELLDAADEHCTRMLKAASGLITKVVRKVDKSQTLDFLKHMVSDLSKTDDQELKQLNIKEDL